RTEFEVAITDWAVSGTNRGYSVAGPGSRRFEDHDIAMSYSGSWTETHGNYSGGTIHHASAPSAAVTLAYQAQISHTLYLGARYVATGATVHINVDGTALADLNLAIAGEDVLFRWPLGTYAAGAHTVTATIATGGGDFYFDFFELASPASDLPVFDAQAKLT